MEDQKLYISSSVAGNLPAMVRNELAKLPAQKQEEFLEEYSRKQKSLAFGYILWLLLGWHYAYQKKWGLQILFWITAGGLLFWWLIDAFRLPGMISDYNKDKAVDTMRNLQAISR